MKFKLQKLQKSLFLTFVKTKSYNFRVSNFDEIRLQKLQKSSFLTIVKNKNYDFSQFWEAKNSNIAKDFIFDVPQRIKITILANFETKYLIIDKFQAADVCMFYVSKVLKISFFYFSGTTTAKIWRI